MKKFYLLAFAFIFSSIALKAQQITVALHHNGTATMFYGNSGLSDAYAAATSGDTIYLPGKSHYGGLTIAKSLVIIGAGHNPDSTIATGITYIEGDIRFASGASGSVLEGIYSTNNIYFNGDVRVNDVKIRRCNVPNIYFEGSFDTTHTCKRVYIEQNVIRGEIACDNSDYLTIRNNYIAARIRNISQNGLIENNILYHQTDWGYWSDNPSNSTLYSVYGSLIRNNIFMKPIYRGSCCIAGSNNDVMNNIFGFTSADCWSSNYSNNYNNIGCDTIFVGQTGAYTSFDYSQNYHLKNPSAYPGFASMGVGVYGGTEPFKQGFVPVNPHINARSIDPATNNNGKLGVSIKVEAQQK